MLLPQPEVNDTKALTNILHKSVATNKFSIFQTNKVKKEHYLIKQDWKNECLITPQHKNKLATGCQTNRKMENGKTR